MAPVITALFKLSKDLPLDNRTDLACSIVRRGLAADIREITPATRGLAIDVPLEVLY
jgi:hypothetical protein